MRKSLMFITSLFFVLMVTPGRTQEPPKVIETAKRLDDPVKEEKQEKDEKSTGLSILNSDRLRVRLRFMGHYGLDESQAGLGYEKQGEPGYLIGELYGKLNEHLSYRFEVNAVNNSQPGVSCGEKYFFYPNERQSDVGPNMACDNNGRMKVDDYRFRGLDPLIQAGFIRQAYVRYEAGMFSGMFGRFILPIGFFWEDAGSFTTKDAPHIQRINAEASFGFQVALSKQARGRTFVSVSLAGVTGDGNKFHDYDYFYGIDGSLDSNSWPTGVLSGSIEPLKHLEFRAALKKGDTGSKVERLPNFYASKRNDDAVVLSARYRPSQYVSLFGEKATYTWGLMKTSAELLGLDQSPVKKAGYYVGADLGYPVTNKVRVGTIVTREELSRDDALVKYMSEQGKYNVSLGKKERSTVLRFYVDFAKALRVGAYRNSLSNPFPWLSGIEPVLGPSAYQGRGNNKWGYFARITIE